MAGIAISGLSSGLDTEGMISQLMAIEAQPKTRLTLEQGKAQARQTALQSALTKLKAVQSAGADLRSAALWADTQTVESADPTKISAKRLSGAGPGGYGIEVSQLARAEQRTFSFTSSGSASQIVVNGHAVDLAAGASITDAVAAINADSASGVYAVNVSGNLVLSSRTTGVAGGFTATGAGIAEDGSKAKAGRDALFSIDGVAGSSSSNTIQNAVPGLEITLKGVTTSEVAVTVGDPGPDKDAVKAKLKAFVDAYNAAVTDIRGKLTEKRVPNAATQADANKGVLFGDSGLSSVLSSLRQSVSDIVGGNPGNLDELADIGVSTGAANPAVTSASDSVSGLLTFDATKLDTALSGDSLGVRRLLGGISGVDGFSQRLEGVLAPTTGAAGAMQGRLTAAQDQLNDLRDQMSQLDTRLAAKQDRYRAQFARLETLLSQSQSQGQWLSGQLAQLG